MAANWKSGGGIASLGKRLLNRTTTRHPTLFNATTSPSLPSPRASAIRSVHASAYDKNIDDQLRPTVVPDYVIQPQSDDYWVPDPQTGVFGPAAGLNTAAGGEQRLRSSLGNGGLNSVLDETAWFRPTGIEDLEKPHHL